MFIYIYIYLYIYIHIYIYIYIYVYIVYIYKNSLYIYIYLYWFIYYILSCFLFSYHIADKIFSEFCITFCSFLCFLCHFSRSLFLLTIFCAGCIYRFGEQRLVSNGLQTSARKKLKHCQPNTVLTYFSWTLGK